MDQHKPQYFGANGLKRGKNPSKLSVKDRLGLLNTVKKKKRKKPVLSEESAKQIAMVLKGMLRKK